MRPLARYAEFKGRSGRAEFWAFMLMVWVVYAGLYAWILTPLIPIFQTGKADVEIASHLLASFGVMMLAGLLLFLPTLAVQVRRLHDSNRTGWWVLLPTGFSMAGQHLAYIFNAEAIMTETVRSAAAVEAMEAFDLQSVWQAYWPSYQLTLPWAMAPSLAASLILLAFYLWPGSKGVNRFGSDPRADAST